MRHVTRGMWRLQAAAPRARAHTMYMAMYKPPISRRARRARNVQPGDWSGVSPFLWQAKATAKSNVNEGVGRLECVLYAMLSRAFNHEDRIVASFSLAVAGSRKCLFAEPLWPLFPHRASCAQRGGYYYKLHTTHGIPASLRQEVADFSRKRFFPSKPSYLMRTHAFRQWGGVAITATASQPLSSPQRPRRSQLRETETSDASGGDSWLAVELLSPRFAWRLVILLTGCLDAHLAASLIPVTITSAHRQTGPPSRRA